VREKRLERPGGENGLNREEGGRERGNGEAIQLEQQVSLRANETREGKN